MKYLGLLERLIAEAQRVNPNVRTAGLRIMAADAGYFSSIAQYDDLQVLMAAQVAAFYCSIRTLEARLVSARENAAIQKRSLQITERSTTLQH